MDTHSIYALAAALLVLAQAGCGDSNPIPAYLKNTWGIQISGFTGDFAVAADGTQTYSGTGAIAVDGLGSNQIISTTTVSPAAMGGETTLTVANLDGSDERYFLYDSVQNYITIGDYSKGAAVSKNADGTYEVWAFDGTNNRDQDLIVPNGVEALKLVEQYNTFKTISPYILLAATRSLTARPRTPAEGLFASGIPRPHRSSATSSKSSATAPPAWCSNVKVPVCSAPSSEARCTHGTVTAKFLAESAAAWGRSCARC